jgi:vacuolar-type H+-ATPase subunit D/Vma8
MIREKVKQAQLKVQSHSENVSGVQIPAFELYQEGSNGT